MYAYYRGGTQLRYLDVDDIRGVCSLYTQTCACTTHQDCLPGQQCGANGCEDIPCTADSECSGSLVCLDGECVQQPCTNDSDCAPDFQCRNSLCVSKCPTCRPCTSSLDCDGGTCLDVYQETKKCLVLCAEDLSCPGDSVCFDLSDEDGPFFVCLNPDAETEDICPESYLCKESSASTLDAEDPDQAPAPSRSLRVQSTGCSTSTLSPQSSHPAAPTALLLAALLILTRCRPMRPHQASPNKHWPQA